MSPALLQRRDHLLRISRNLVPRNRPLTPAERASLTSIHQEMLALEDEIESDASRRSARAFNNWLAFGLEPHQFEPRGGITEDEKAAISVLSVARHEKRLKEWTDGKQPLSKRDMSLGVLGGAYPDSSQGFFAPLSFSTEVENAMKDFGSMLATSTNMETVSGNLLYVPTSDDRSQTGERVPENIQMTDIDPAINNVQLSSYKYSSRVVKCSLEFLRDCGPDVPAWLAHQFAVRLARCVNTDLTIGTGSGMPTGLLNAVSVGAIAVGSGPNDGSNPSLTNVVGQQDLVNLVESVDVAYRNAPGAGFILNDSTLSQIKKLTDKEGRPLNLFRSRLENPSGVDTLLGHACYTNPNMPTLQTQASSPQTTIRSVLFGDLSRYRIRRTRLTVQRLVQKWAEYGLVAFLATYRLDGQLVDGSVGIGNGFAVKALTNSF